jgi:hypothetical protein
VSAPAIHAFSWQVNLLDTGLQSRARPRSRLPLIPSVIAAALIAAVAAYTQAMRSQLADLRARTEVAEARFKDLERRAGPAAGAAAEAQRQSAEALEAELAQKRALLDGLKQALAADGEPWTASAALAALSEHHREGVWLTKIRIDRLRRELALEGRATDAQGLSTYVAGLGKGASALAQMSVSAITGERDEAPGSAAPAGASGERADAPRGLSFKLSSKRSAP